MTNSWAELLTKNLRVGSVIYKHCDFTTPPKPKYLLVASLEPRLLVIVINSSINDFYKKNSLDKYHVLLPAGGDHEFLDHDSYANCLEAKDCFDLEDIRRELLSNYADLHKGWLSTECLELVHDSVAEQPLIRTGLKNEILTGMKAQLDIEKESGTNTEQLSPQT